MLSVTNNIKTFFEVEEGDIVIYGAGNAGYWIGYFMLRCNIDFLCYLDKNAGMDGIPYNNRPVYHPEYLSKTGGTKLRIIISPICCDEILGELTVLSDKYKFDALCLRPVFKYFVDRAERYDINRLLSYFRRKLFAKDIPTIISNDCIAGEIYNLMNLYPISPTVNTGMDFEDFQKVFENPMRYLKENVNDLRWERPKQSGVMHRDQRVIGAKLGDVRLRFAHINMAEFNGFEEYAERWHLMSERIAWNNIVFILRSIENTIPISVLKSFSKVKEKHLVIFIGENMAYQGIGDSISLRENIFFQGYDAIENHFDIVGWMNDVSEPK